MIRSCNNLHIINKRAVVLNTAFALLLFNTMFLSFQEFVEAETLSKLYAFVAGSLLCCLGTLLTIKTPKIRIDSITILTSIFVGYLLLISFFTPLIPNNIHVLSLISFIFLYFTFRLIPSDYLRNIDNLILCVCVAQACYGLMQYVGVLNSYKIFKIVGSFDNPAGFAACLSTGLPFCLSVIPKGSWKRCVGILALMIIIISTILSESIAGVIAAIIVSFLYFGSRYYNYLIKYRKYLVLATIFTLLLLGLQLFFLKKKFFTWTCIDME